MTYKLKRSRVWFEIPCLDDPIKRAAQALFPKDYEIPYIFGENLTEVTTSQ